MNILFNWKNFFVISVFLIIIGLSLTEEASINIELKGFINKPGVYKITEELTVFEAINLAGGLKENADTSQINLSKKVYDEMVIIVPAKEDTQALNTWTSIKYIENECSCPLINDSCVTLNPPEDIIIESKKISLNSASKEELMTLSGIGESKALAIIEYRKLNKFKTIEEIMNVKGIGNSIYEKIKDYVTI